MEHAHPPSTLPVSLLNLMYPLPIVLSANRFCLGLRVHSFLLHFHARRCVLFGENTCRCDVKPREDSGDNDQLNDGPQQRAE